MRAYRDYLKEKKGQVLEERPEGFFVWHVMNDKAVFISEVFVQEEHRQKGLLKKWTKELFAILPKEVVWLFCEVDTKDKKPELSLAALLSYGCKIHEIKDNRHIVCYYKIDRGES